MRNYLPEIGGEVLQNFASVQMESGDLEGAEVSFQEALRVAQATDHVFLRMAAINGLGNVYLRLERHGEIAAFSGARRFRILPGQ